MTDLSPRHCPTCTCNPVAIGTAENSTWGECVGEAKLCDGGTVKDDPRYTCGYQCTGGRHIGPGRYIRCTDSSHRPAAAANTVFIAADTTVAPVFWAQCGHFHPFGIACSMRAGTLEGGTWHVRS